MIGLVFIIFLYNKNPSQNLRNINMNRLLKNINTKTAFAAKLTFKSQTSPWSFYFPPQDVHSFLG